MGALNGLSRDQVVWGVVGLLLTVVVAFVLYSFIGALVFGVFFYYALRPIERWLRARMDRPDISVTVTLLVVGLPTLLVLGYAVLVGADEINQLLQQQDGDGVQSLLQPYADVAALTRPERLASLTQENLGAMLSYAGTTFLWVVRLFVIFTVAFYLLRDDAKLADWYRDSFQGVHGAVTFMEGVDDDLTTIYTGNLITIAVTGLLAAAVFYAFDFLAGATVIAYPFLLGLLVGIFTLVPVVGMKAIYLPYAAYLFVRSLAWGQLPVWIPIAFLVVTVVVIDVIPDVFIRSYVSRGGINMGLMMLSYVLGSIAFGWYGVFLGPIVLVLALHFATDVLPRLVEGRSILVTTD